MRVTVKFEGGRELDRALSELPRSLQRGVLTRTLRKAGEPIRAAAAGFAAKDTGELAASISVSPKISNSVGKSEFAAAMKAGLGKGAAVKALRDARRSAGGEASTAIMFVGPAQAKTKKDAIKRIANEFGTSRMAAQPYMRPAWDSQKDAALGIIRTEMWEEIEKTAKRYAKRMAKKAATV